MRILCFGYRSWALNIYSRLQKETKNQFIVTGDQGLVDNIAIKALNPSVILFYGWSWIVPKEVIKSYPCFMLHPSDLPKYRGGSPIQNQILDGVSNSKLCLFRMESELDSGPIYGKRNLELTGEVSDIFARLEDLGTELTLGLLHDEIEVEGQNEAEATYCKRRTPDESEITISDLTHHSGQKIFDKIRCLTDPYPNAYIKTKEGKRLIIHSASLKD